MSPSSVDCGKDRTRPTLERPDRSAEQPDGPDRPDEQSEPATPGMPSWNSEAVGTDTAPQREHARQTSGDQSTGGEDVLLDVPVLNVDAIDLEGTDIRLRVSLQAEVLNLVRLNVGVDASLGQVRLDMRGVGAQALLKVRLDNIAEILNRVLTTIDSHPEIVQPLTQGTGQGGQGGQGQGQGGQGQGGPQQGGQGQLQGGQDQGQAQAEQGQPQGGQQQEGQQGQGGGRRSIEACATVDLESRRRDDAAQRQEGPPSARDQAGERWRYQGLPRRARRRW